MLVRRARFYTATQPKLHCTRAHTDKRNQPFTVSTNPHSGYYGLAWLVCSRFDPSQLRPIVGCTAICKSVRTLLLHLLLAWSDRAS